MQRDWNLVRRILFKVEETHTPGNTWIEDFNIGEGTDQAILSEHIRLLHQAGLIEALDLSSSTEFCWKPISLTWAGYEFLDNSRDEKTWKTALQFFAQKIGVITFETLAAKLSDMAIAKIG